MNVPILEVGGTHVTAAWISQPDWAVLQASRLELDATADGPRLVAALTGAAVGLRAPAGARWGIALPGPFDYQSGVARYTGVGKFDQLNGVNLRAELTRGLRAAGSAPGELTFLNDASAFLIGEWLGGAAQGTRRSMALTLGTGVGSAFLTDGEIVDAGPTVPEQGEVHLLSYRGLPLEDWVSRRAIRKSYGQWDADVDEIATRARAGDGAARRALTDAFAILGEVIGPWAKRFRAEVLVLGGSISGSFDLVEGPLRAGLAGSADATMTVARAHNLDSASLIGAAYWAGRASERTLRASTGPSPAPSSTSP
ncbi:MAG: glkA2 [Frankiales bacterium]|nr:glkA2 [Frankiales bacterium]